MDAGYLFFSNAKKELTKPLPYPCAGLTATPTMMTLKTTAPQRSGSKGSLNFEEHLLVSF